MTLEELENLEKGCTLYTADVHWNSKKLQYQAEITRYIYEYISITNSEFPQVSIHVSKGGPGDRHNYRMHTNYLIFPTIEDAILAQTQYERSSLEALNDSIVHNTNCAEEIQRIHAKIHTSKLKSLEELEILAGKLNLENTYGLKNTWITRIIKKLINKVLLTF
jgi:hypothetical protein